MENGSMSNTGPLISPATSFNKLALSKQQFEKRRKVIIGNLPDILDVKEFKEKLLQGYVADDVKCEKNAVTILFSNADQAATAVKALNNQPFNGYPIKAEYAQPDSLLFVGNLPFDFSEEQFVALMSQYGPVDRIFLVRSEVTGESKGYGFVEYPNKELAAQSKQSLMNTDSKYIGGRILRVDFAEPNLSSYMDLHSKTLFVDKLPRDFTNGEVLREIFSRTGTVTFAQVAVNHQTGASRGFAFVDYATSDDAERGQKAHNGAQIEGSNIRVAYGTPGRTGASILGIQSTNTTQVVNQIPLIQAGPVNIRGMVPQWTAQPMQPAAPHPLMARPLIVNSPQNSEVRGPAPRFQAPLIAQAGSPAQVCSPRAALLVRPLTRETNTRMGAPPQRPIVAGPQVRRPRPLMADFPIRVPDPRQGGPRGFSPRGMATTGDPRCAVFRNGPVRPLMSLNSNKNGIAPEESLEANQPFAPQMEQTLPGPIRGQPVNQFQPQQQQLQALMQSPVQQQQQRLVTPQLQQIQQPPPQPSPQNFRPAEAQAPPALAPQPLPLVAPNIGGQKGGPMEGTGVPGVKGGFDIHGQQAPPPGSVVLLGPGNSQQSEYQIPRPVSGPVPQQGLQIRPPAAVAAAFQTSQSPVKTFLPPPAADQMPVRPPGPTPLMAATNHIPPGGQPRPPFTNETQNIPSLAPVGQAAPVQFGVPSLQPMAPPQPLMQLPDQTAPHVSVAQRPAVGPSQQDPTMQYQNYGFQQQVPTVEQVGTPFMADQVRPPPPPQQQTGPTLQASHENTRVVQGVQHQLPIQQQTPAYPNQVGQVFQPSQQQMFQQGTMAPAADAQWMHPVGNAQQPVPLMSVQGFQVPPIQEQQPPRDISTQQWRPAQHPTAQLQTGYSQFKQEPQQQLFNPAQQFHLVAQPPDPSYQQQQQLPIASNTSTPSPIPQHSAAPVMYNTQTSPNEPNQHGQKRPPDHQLSDQSYVNQPRPLLGIGEFYDTNKRPRF